MDPVLVVFGGLILFFVLFSLLLGLRSPWSARRKIEGMAERRSATDAEIEAHDIDQMLDARNALRRRMGRPELGDELAEQARREARED